MSPFRKEDYACSKSFDITNLIGGVPFIPKLRTMNSLPMQVPQDNLNYCFVNSNGQVSTSDSVKGEDEIIYGFTEDGLQSYFAKNHKGTV